jgi:hypothetical protein
MILDSLWIRNVSISLEKWFSVESESFYEIIWSVYWNVSNSVKIRRKWIRITWNIYFTVSWLQYKKLKRFKPILTLKSFNFFPFGTAPWNVSPYQMRPKIGGWIIIFAITSSSPVSLCKFIDIKEPTCKKDRKN